MDQRFTRTHVVSQGIAYVVYQQQRLQMIDRYNYGPLPGWCTVSSVIEVMGRYYLGKHLVLPRQGTCLSVEIDQGVFETAVSLAHACADADRRKIVAS